MTRGVSSDPSAHLLIQVRHDDGDMTGPLQDLGGASAGTGPEPLEGRAFVGESLGNDQLLSVKGVIVLRVSYRGIENLGHGLGGATLCQSQDMNCFWHRKTTNEIENPAHLVWRLPDISCLGFYLHERFAALSA